MKQKDIVVGAHLYYSRYRDWKAYGSPRYQAKTCTTR